MDNSVRWENCNPLTYIDSVFEKNDKILIGITGEFYNLPLKSFSTQLLTNESKEVEKC